MEYSMSTDRCECVSDNVLPVNNHINSQTERWISPPTTCMCLWIHELFVLILPSRGADQVLLWCFTSMHICSYVSAFLLKGNYMLMDCETPSKQTPYYWELLRNSFLRPSGFSCYGTAFYVQWPIKFHWGFCTILYAWVCWACIGPNRI